MKIVIYGLGNRGRAFIETVYEMLQEIEIVAVTDTYVQSIESLMCDNKLYIKPTQIKDYEYDFIIVTPENYFYEIRKKLIESGVDFRKIKSLNEFEMNRKKFQCNICGNEIFAWKYIGEDYKIFHEKNIAGAGRRRGGCSVCGSSDRARFVYYVIENFTKLMNKNECKILHFAPEKAISEKLREIHGKQYISADIMSGRADVIANIVNLQFHNEEFDYIICNHVMEHICEEKRAFSEVRRCLKPGGILIFTAPICWTQETYEDDNVLTVDDRIRYYGQEDHVRLYGNDIVERIEKFGFDVNLLCCNEIGIEDEIRKFGFLRNDSALLCKRKDKKSEIQRCFKGEGISGHCSI